MEVALFLPPSWSAYIEQAQRRSSRELGGRVPEEWVVPDTGEDHFVALAQFVKKIRRIGKLEIAFYLDWNVHHPSPEEVEDKVTQTLQFYVRILGSPEDRQTDILLLDSWRVYVGRNFIRLGNIQGNIQWDADYFITHELAHLWWGEGIVKRSISP